MTSTSDLKTDATEYGNITPIPQATQGRSHKRNSSFVGGPAKQNETPNSGRGNHDNQARDGLNFTGAAAAQGPPLAANDDKNEQSIFGIRASKN